jgi:hypothetical protein
MTLQGDPRGISIWSESQNSLPAAAQRCRIATLAMPVNIFGFLRAKLQKAYSSFLNQEIIAPEKTGDKHHMFHPERNCIRHGFRSKACSPNRFTCMGFLLLSKGCIPGLYDFASVSGLASHSGCLGPHDFTLVSHLFPKQVYLYGVLTPFKGLHPWVA